MKRILLLIFLGLLIITTLGFLFIRKSSSSSFISVDSKGINKNFSLDEAQVKKFVSSFPFPKEIKSVKVILNYHQDNNTRPSKKALVIMMTPDKKMYVVDSKEDETLFISILVDKNSWNSFSFDIQRRYLQIGLIQGLVFVSDPNALTQSKRYTDLFRQILTQSGSSLWFSLNSSPANFLDKIFKSSLNLFVKEIYAQNCVGQVECGIPTSGYFCSDKSSCDPAIPTACSNNPSDCQFRNVCLTDFFKECTADFCPSVGGCGIESCTISNTCTRLFSSPTPTPSGACVNDYCAGVDQCLSQGGTTGAVGPRPSGGNCASGQVMCCLPGGGGGGGGGGDPCPGDTCAGFCCNYACGHTCIVSADCRNAATGQTFYCNPATQKCVNPICPDNTVPGTICACSGGSVCGQRCAGPCEPGSNSSCRFTNAPSGSCTDTASTYCIGDTGNGVNTFNPSYTTPQCASGDTGNKYLLGPGGQSAGFTQAQIDSTCKPGAWWQVKDGDVVTNGRIASIIPVSCTLPACNPNFNLDGGGGFPGVVSYGSALTPVFSASGGSGVVSSKGWLANSANLTKPYSYSFFEGLIPPEASVNEIAADSINGNYFQVNGTPSNSFVWFRRTGNLTITGNVNVNAQRKVILLVKGGDLNISSQVRLKKTGDGFFLAVVNGSIFFDPTLTGSAGAPAVEGLFMADNQIRTGAGSQQLYVRGTLAAYGGIVLERDLGDANSAAPAELIEYAPDLIFAYPRSLTRTRVIWKEVAP